MKDDHEIDPEDKFWEMVSDDDTIDFKIILFILSIPFLMVLGKFLIVWDVTEFIFSTFACVCIFLTILFGGRTNENE